MICAIKFDAPFPSITRSNYYSLQQLLPSSSHLCESPRHLIRWNFEGGFSFAFNSFTIRRLFMVEIGFATKDMALLIVTSGRKGANDRPPIFGICWPLLRIARKSPFGSCPSWIGRRDEGFFGGCFVTLSGDTVEELWSIVTGVKVWWMVHSCSLLFQGVFVGWY